MSPQAKAAFIAGAVSLIGVVVSVLSSQWQLASAREKMRADAEALRQTLLKDVLAKRMEAYSALWSVMITFDLNWVLEGKPLTLDWASSFLQALNECNAKHGVFFSQAVYEKFVAYRSCLVQLVRKGNSGESITSEDHASLVRISAGTDGKPGLATVLKDDLGSYIPVHLQVGTLQPRD